MTVSLITGTSTGIGRATAICLARAGHRVYATMRTPETSGEKLREAVEAEKLPVTLLALDVDDPASVERAVAEVLAEAGQIDVLVNNAGILIGPMAIEETSDEEIRASFETNTFGPVRMMRAVLPGMRERRSGTIVNVTSCVGRVTFGTHGIYAGSKCALDAISESVALEVAPFGIRVAIIEPGVIMTPILGKGRGPDPASPYRSSLVRLFRPMSKAASLGTRASVVGEAVLHAIETDTPKLRYPVGPDAEQMIPNRAKLSDEEWLSYSLLESDDEHLARMEAVFGLK